MNIHLASDHLTEALARAHEHWRERHAGEGTARGVTIAFSRQAGTYGAAIAREVANRLGWPIYDHELVTRIAEDMGVRRNLLESIDERRVGWLHEAMASLLAGQRVNDEAYFRHLIETLYSLSAHGNCVIVGRGAPAALPLSTTLRVRLIAPLEYRIAAVREEHGGSMADAAKRVETTDGERDRFISSHFGIDPNDPTNFDMVLNVARFNKAECVDLILAGYERMRKHANQAGPAKEPAPVG
ncbi:MAG TPA: cytidylate kinase-like family protein [Gemmataceae bacterium]|nr:cytidylate kinase-like family protein [Gemmataceae bacterium]